MKPLALTIPDAVQVSGQSRSALYILLKNKKIAAVKAGRRTLIRYDSLVAYMDSLPTYPTAG